MRGSYVRGQVALELLLVLLVFLAAVGLLLSSVGGLGDSVTAAGAEQAGRERANAQAVADSALVFNGLGLLPLGWSAPGYELAGGGRAAARSGLDAYNATLRKDGLSPGLYHYDFE